MTQGAQPFITAAQLAERAAGGRPLTILDVRNQQGLADGRPEYEAGHIPNAVYVHLSTELQGKQDGFSGNRPVPDIADLQERARSWGIDDGDDVVVYDNVFGAQAARAWWTLRWAGLDNVRLLDGGYAAWVGGGYPISTQERPPERGEVTLSPGHMPTLDADAAAAHAEAGTLFDARGAKQYDDGHIPGAHLAPSRDNLTETGLLADEASLRDRFASLGIDGSTPVGVYCGGGTAAAHEVAVLTSLGIPATLFVGSFSAWSSDPSRPVARAA